MSTLKPRTKSAQRISRLRKVIAKKTEYLTRCLGLVARMKAEILSLRGELHERDMALMAYRYGLLEEGKIEPADVGYVLKERKQVPKYQITENPVETSSGMKAKMQNIQEVVEVREIWIRTAKPESLQGQPTLGLSGSSRAKPHVSLS